MRKIKTFTSVSKLKKRFECSTGKVNADFARKLERERDEAREELRQWQTLRLYGAEPEHIHEYIKRLRFDEVNNGNPTD